MKLYSSEVLEGLTDESKKQLQNYLDLYTESAHVNYKSAISRLMKQSKKNHFMDLTYDDFRPTADSIDRSQKKKTGDTYVETFFKYLFANDIVTDNRFNERWIKDDLIKHFVSLLGRSESTNETKQQKKVLDIEQILKIQEIMNAEYSKFDMLRKSLVWYLLFDTNIEIDELRLLTSDNFVDNGIILKNGQKLTIPQKFHPVFKELSEKQYNGFHSLPDIVRGIGELIGIPDLLPRIIKNTRNANMLQCSNCHKKYTNLQHNWMSINGRIVCTSCSEVLKKNSFKPLAITNEDVNFQPEEMNINVSSVIYTYDELKSKLPRTINYLELHAYQMKIGKLGEAFVYKIERERLKGTKYEELIDESKALNEKNGYDILSYDENGNEIYIEVKTTVGKETEFYITQHEVDVAKQCASRRQKYYIYRVTSILDDAEYEIITNIFDSDKYRIVPHSNKVNMLS